MVGIARAFGKWAASLPAAGGLILLPPAKGTGGMSTKDSVIVGVGGLVEEKASTVVTGPFLDSGHRRKSTRGSTPFSAMVPKDDTI